MTFLQGISNLLRKLRGPSSARAFYTDKQVRFLAEHAKGLEELEATGHVPCTREDSIRFMQLSQHIRETRAAAMLSPIMAAERLQIGVDQVVAIELLHTGPLDPVVFWKYCELLGLNDYVTSWIAANPETARRLNIVDD